MPDNDEVLSRVPFQWIKHFKVFSSIPLPMAKGDDVAPGMPFQRTKCDIL